MPTLTQCTYCKRDMSSEVTHCPHCSRRVPRGVNCAVCCEQMSNVDAVEKKYRGYEYLHPDCYDRVMEDVKCHLCKRIFTASEQQEWKKPDYERPEKATCSNCKTQSRYSICCCGVYVINEHPYEIIGDDHFIVHSRCGESRRRRNKINHENLIAQRKRDKVCLFCGEELTFWEKFFRLKMHRYQWSGKACDSD